MALYYDEILAGNCLGQINIAPPATPQRATMTDKGPPAALSEQFGLSVDELFQRARQFLKDQQGSAELQLKYVDKNRLLALSKQVKIGKWDASHTPDVGFLDVVGNDRKQAWIALGNMSKEQAMEAYVNLLLERCGAFRTHIERQQVVSEADDQVGEDDATRRALEQQAERARQNELAQYSRLEKKQRQREDFQRKQVQDVLNQQTYLQFKAYAEQQYKDNPEAQEELIRQLQEQHFQQYMNQAYQQQLLDQQQFRNVRSNMEQQPTDQTTAPADAAATFVPPPPPLTMIPPPSGPMVAPPTSLNLSQTPVPTSVATATSPINAIAPSASVNTASPGTAFPAPLANIPVQPMSPLGPAPAQLPPLAHPPPPPMIPFPPVSHMNATGQEIKLEPIVPMQAQFETLSLNSPLTPIPPPGLPSPTGNEPAQQPVPSEPSAAQETLEGSGLAAASAGADGELAVPGEEAKERPPVTPANMWTRKDVKEFKEQIRKEKDAVIKVGSGETVTVRVPTHEDGQSIFWEFATDYYDVGFGVYFEWSKSPSNTVTVHVSDSSDEEEPEDGGNPEKKDIEKGSGSTNKPPKPPQDEIVPIYRRDSHEEVNAGSHSYPGQGVYLLKFDNSYSLWRSKTLYYRVYYSK